MNQDLTLLLPVLAGTGFLVSILLSGWLLMQKKQLAAQVRHHERRIDSLQADIHALTAAATGVDTRLLRLETLFRNTTGRVEKLEGQMAAQRPYREAIALVKKGASSTRLMNELQLSEGEAQLIAALHTDESRGDYPYSATAGF